jgi:hypothetical protein
VAADAATNSPKAVLRENGMLEMQSSGEYGKAEGGIEVTNRR